MRAAFLLGFGLVAAAGHGVVVSGSTAELTPLDATWNWVGQMGGASAVAIGPRTVLTSAHVRAGDFTLGSSTYRFTSSLVAPKIKGVAVDLRVVHLSETLPGWYAMAKTIKSGATLTMVGYGRGGTVNGTRNGYQLAGTSGRRAGTNRLTRKQSLKNIGPSLISMLDGPGEAVLTSGDSGGGWFVDGKLVGLSSSTLTYKPKLPSYGWQKSAYFGSAAVDLTNPVLANWINAQVAGQSVRSIQAVPEPSSICALLTGLVALTVRRRKR